MPSARIFGKPKKHGPHLSDDTYLLKAAVNARRKYRGESEVDAMEFLSFVRERVKKVQMNPDMLHRGVNEGFSGGEKKRNELIQMLLLQPQLAIMDETDSGLDIDALQVVASAVNAMRSPERSFILVTHYLELCPFCRKTGSKKIRVDGFVSYLGTDVKTHAGHATVCSSHARFLAFG